MSRLSLRLIKSALLCLALGIGLGALFGLNRALGAQLRPVHAELNLWGWATLLCYGMAYHMLPRFRGRALRWPALAEAQSWLAISGVGLAATGWFLQSNQLSGARIVLLLGGGLQVLAALVFAGLLGELLSSQPAAAARRGQEY